MKTALTLLLSASVLGLASTAHSQEKAVTVDKKAISAKKPLGHKDPRRRLDAFGNSLKAAVKAGKLTEKEAIAEWEAVKGKRPQVTLKRLPPKRPAKPQISDEVKGQLEAIKKDKDALKEAIGAELEKLGLGKDSSKEDVIVAVEAFKEANKDRFDAIKAASDKVHEVLKAARPERKKRPEPTPEIKAKIAAVKAVGKKLHDARSGLRKNLKDATKEDRKSLIETFKADNKDKHEELKAAHKELKEAVRAAKETGDSRTSE